MLSHHHCLPIGWEAPLQQSSQVITEKGYKYHPNFPSSFSNLQTHLQISTGIVLNKRSMALAGQATLLLCLLLLTPLLSVESISGDGIHCVYSLKKDGFRTGSRKMLALDAVLDYDYAGPNPKHDPRKGRPGGRNP